MATSFYQNRPGVNDVEKDDQESLQKEESCVDPHETNDDLRRAISQAIHAQLGRPPRFIVLVVVVMETSCCGVAAFA